MRWQSGFAKTFLNLNDLTPVTKIAPASEGEDLFYSLIETLVNL